jgi:hypothetical protein
MSDTDAATPPSPERGTDVDSSDTHDSFTEPGHYSEPGFGVDAGPDSEPDDGGFTWVDPEGTRTGPPAEGLVLLSDEPARARRHVGRYVALAAAALVAGAAIVTGPTLWRVYSARHTTLTLPSQVAGLSRDSAGDSQQTAEYLRDAVGTGTSLGHPFGAVYDLGGDTAHSVLVFGGTGSIFRPARTLTGVLALLGDSSDAIRDLHEVAPGALGGMMKCGISPGSGDIQDQDMPICGWADHGSAAAALFPGRTEDQAADLMRQFRTAMEKS